MKSAAAPIFCIKLDIKATVPEISAIILVSLLPASLRICLARIFITPVLSRAAPMMIIAMMDITAFELKPLIASLASTMFRRGRDTTIMIPTTSTRTAFVMNNIMATAMTARVIPISWVKTAPSILRVSPFKPGRL